MDVEEITKAIADQLKAERVIAGMTQQQIAEAADIPLVSYQRYEKGSRQIPLMALLQIAEALSIPAARIIERAEGRLDN